MSRLLACLLAILILGGAQAASAQSEAERLESALATSRAGNPQAAYAEVDALAKQGYTPAYFVLGSMYSGGIGVTQSKMLARNWFLKSAQSGDTRGMFNIALYFDQGIGGAKDPAAALHYYKLAAAAGDHEAGYNAGQMMLTGDGVETDLDAGTALIQQAADAGFGKAQLTLGYQYAVGLGVPISIAKTEHYYRAAMAGDQLANEARARLWDFEDDLIAQGTSLMKDGTVSEASAIFDELCGAGNGDACYHLGRTWMTGEYESSPDYRQAMPNFRRGCALESYYACQGLAYATVNAPFSPSEADRDQAADFFEGQCEWGEHGACVSLAYMKFYRRFDMYDYEGAKAVLLDTCFNKGYDKACEPYYSIHNAEISRRSRAENPPVSTRRNWGILDGLTAMAEGLSNYGGGGSYTSYSGGSASSGSSYSSTSSYQDTQDFNNAINAINNIGTGYNSSCRSGNPYC